MTARRTVLPLVVLVTLGAPACGNNSSTSPTSTTTSTTANVTFTGTLNPGAFRFYSFSISTSGTVTALLASVAASDSHLPLDVPLQIGVGVPSGIDCATTTSEPLSAALVSQLSVPLAAGTYCLRVGDTGALRVPVTFAVRFTYPS